MNANKPNSETRRSAALASGISLLLMAAAAAYAYGFVHSRLILPDDPAATAANLRASSGLFRTEIFGWLVILICDVVAAWALYVYFEPVQRGLSLLAAGLRFAYTAVLGTAAAFLVLALLWAERSETVMNGLLDDSAALLTGTFDLVWSIGLVVFGLHLLVLGILALRAAFMPRWVGVLLLIAGPGYLIVHLARLLLPGGMAIPALLETALSVPMAAGELGLALWLLIRGGRETAVRPLPAPNAEDVGDAGVRSPRSSS
ncbi:DUF4386 domain-containing protein [Saccharibacillus alkalitolerans]|uniref:DUF4386 domain-containing protein n=1 Tax=Saccharibacillus alkalitolerans TaxID=2705290 RepID=A0ABX0FAH7_9BACL|nr:DUF4386 domain-containing protein [Saccharibacillus alkalitolerans]NGZ76484.1 DUF4386 domain-containing protein [Saccharibacillus alkalitolerans]